jgi:RHS repeat-associated protein
LIEGSRTGTGKVYQRNRYLDPETGRFTQEDPIGLARGLNLYGYAEGDPVNFSDPFGLEPCSTAQSEHGWKDVTTSDGAKECQSNKDTKPIVITAERSSFGNALKFGWMHNGEINEGMRWGDVEPVQIGVPAWMGGPAAGEMTAAKIIAKFKKGSINEVFPGELRNTTYNEIERLANAGQAAAKTAYKLLKQKRFNK